MKDFELPEPTDRPSPGPIAQSFSFGCGHTSPRKVKRPFVGSVFGLMFLDRFLMDLLDGRFHFFHDSIRQRCVAELAR